jgi:long-chain acyl-CoA synthetase
VLWSGSRQDQRALAGGNDWTDLTGLEQLWGRLAERYGDATALEAPHAKPPEQLSFRDLHSRIEQAAAGFAALGVRPGDVVGLFSENSPRWLVSCVTSPPIAGPWPWWWKAQSC